MRLCISKLMHMLLQTKTMENVNIICVLIHRKDLEVQVVCILLQNCLNTLYIIVQFQIIQGHNIFSFT